jgi:hypothetical protein
VIGLLVIRYYWLGLLPLLQQPHMSTDKNFSSFYSENKSLIREYLDVRVKLLKLQAIKASSRSLGLVFTVFLVASFALFVILFLGIAFALWLGGVTGSNVVGFAGGAGLFFVFLLLIAIFRKPLFMDPLVRKIVSQMSHDLYESDKHEQNQ